MTPEPVTSCADWIAAAKAEMKEREDLGMVMDEQQHNSLAKALRMLETAREGLDGCIWEERGAAREALDALGAIAREP